MKKTWKWAACGYNLAYEKNSDNAEIIKLCKYAGIPAVEANPYFTEGKSEGELERMRRQYEEAGIGLESFHLPFSAEDDIACFYETQRKEIVRRMLAILEVASLSGSRVAILHPSTNRFNLEEEGIERYLLSMGKSLEVLLPKAEESGLILALENMLPGLKGSRLGSRPEHFTLFSAKFGHPHLGFCLDTGHAFIAGGGSGPMDFFEAMGEHVAAFHIQDNPGDRDIHLPPGHGLIDWKPVFDRMASMNFADSACIETPPFAPADHYRYSFNAWKKMIQESDNLVEKCLNKD